MESARVPDRDFLRRIGTLLGPGCWSVDPVEIEPHVRDWRQALRGHTPLLAIPDTAVKVSALLALCHQERVAVTPQGGNTGLVGGGVPFGEILLSTRRLNSIEVRAEDNVLIAGAGAVLAAVQDAAERADRLFPLSLGSEGSASIGGLIATNAGGVAVLRYGTMRQLVLGLEAVLPDGRIWNGMRALHKDNCGVDLKQVFIGSEGTLGVVTAATLRLFPRPRGQEVAWAALASPGRAVALLHRVQGVFGGALTAFELIPRRAVELVARHVPGVGDPVAGADEAWRILIELSFHSAPDAGRRELERVLSEASVAGETGAVALSDSLFRQQAIWRIRESIPEAEKRYSPSVKNDISIPVARLAEFMERAARSIAEASPGAEIIAFGHVGDGNLHYNIFPPPELAEDSGLARKFVTEAGHLTRLVNDMVVGMGGSISAEHGIGITRRDELARLSDPFDLDLKRRVKAAFDPNGIMNPGRILHTR